MQVSVHLVLCEAGVAVVAAVVSCSPPMRHAMRQAAMEAVVYSDLLSAYSPLLHVKKAAPSSYELAIRRRKRPMQKSTCLQVV